MVKVTEGSLSIKCNGNEAYVHDASGNVTSRIDRFSTEGLFGAKPCLTPGVYSPLTPLREDYFKALVTLTKLINCFNQPELYVFIDDASMEFVEESLILSILVNKFGFNFEKLLTLDFKKVVSITKDLIKLRGEIEKLKLKKNFSENDYSIYTSLSIRLDTLLSNLLKLLGGGVEDVVKVYEAVKETQVGLDLRSIFYREINNLNQMLVERLVKRINDSFSESDVKPLFIKLSSLTPRIGEFGFKEALIIIHNFLDQKGCSSKTIVCGEEFAIAIRLLNLDFIVIDLP